VVFVIELEVPTRHPDRKERAAPHTQIE